MKLKIFICVCAFMFVSCLNAKEVTSSSTTPLLKSLQSHFPEAQQKDIQKTPIKGLMAFTNGPTVIYVTDDGRYLFSGDIIDTKEQFNNITESARRQARVNAISELKPAQTVNYVPEEVKHTIMVFTDIDCPYCRKFHDNVVDLNKRGIAVKYLAFPRGGPGSKGYEKAVSVWCAKDPAKAMTLAKQGEEIEKAVCENHAVDKEFQMGVLMGVTGTPSIVLENGIIIPGFLTPDKLEEVFAKMDQF